MLPDVSSNLRECIHSPRIRGSAVLHKTIDLQSIKQLLCQSWEKGENREEKLVKTMTYACRIRVFPDGDMSSQCRHFRTSIMTGRHKLLIVQGSMAVAEGRQGRAPASHQYNKIKQHKGNATLKCSLRTRRRNPIRHLNVLVQRGRNSTLKRTFNFAYCRPFSTLHRPLHLSYTDVRIVIALTVYERVHLHTYVFLAGPQEDSR